MQSVHVQVDCELANDPRRDILEQTFCCIAARSAFAVTRRIFPSKMDKACGRHVQCCHQLHGWKGAESPEHTGDLDNSLHGKFHWDRVCEITALSVLQLVLSHSAIPAVADQAASGDQDRPVSRDRVCMERVSIDRSVVISSAWGASCDGWGPMGLQSSQVTSVMCSMAGNR